MLKALKLKLFSLLECFQFEIRCIQYWELNYCIYSSLFLNQILNA